METSRIVRFAALSASAFITITLLQCVALLGHPRRAADMRVAQTGPSCKSTSRFVRPNEPS